MKLLDMHDVVGAMDIALVTLDTLRFDVAQELFEAGRLPRLGRLLPPGGWERRHSPSNFTYGAHHAFFAGFLPTPTAPGPHPRLFAARFEGSETTIAETYVFDEPTIVEGLAAAGYRTICVGGVGFFNERTPLGRVFPALFHESRWCAEFSVTAVDSTRAQCEWAASRLQATERRVFVFVNVSALHQPNCHYVAGHAQDSRQTHAAALEYVDGALEPLWSALRARGGAFCIVCSDHGTAYGEDGYSGHRLNHPVVTDVPYAHFFVPGES